MLTFFYPKLENLFSLVLSCLRCTLWEYRLYIADEMFQFWHLCILKNYSQDKRDNCIIEKTENCLTYMDDISGYCNYAINYK